MVTEKMTHKINIYVINKHVILGKTSNQCGHNPPSSSEALWEMTRFDKTRAKIVDSL